ncbi:LOW QUALITY PROTEIN: protein CASP-like [Ornithorhynchus anatinus]|uniref:LOW QUALITY PROTEIN: protein CASP-like n=1 Tax=Ornithorhynchus anatinus TaxID=9258 RepID=UPI0019D45B2A|nr:LOW QUALITY PROTEIN: protein CASP-like [Ornithorhynchus anatinus]
MTPTIQGSSPTPRPPGTVGGAAELSLEKIPDPIKEATALFYGSPGHRGGPGRGGRGVLAQDASSPSTPNPEGQMGLSGCPSSPARRERFRARNQELEAEGRLAQRTIQALQSELDSLRADNIKLFEKIKFLQSYPRPGGQQRRHRTPVFVAVRGTPGPFSSFSKRVGPPAPSPKKEAHLITPRRPQPPSPQPGPLPRPSPLPNPRPPATTPSRALPPVPGGSASPASGPDGR